MKLRDYLYFNKIKHKHFAELIGCSKTHLSQLMSGKHNSSKTLAMMIELKTNGLVKESEIGEAI